ncbi:hypothetical protein EOD39_5412 [Acipenser ruthenus]|uniref:Uncharacterized protein n=1 Tax=Acipenser ruthenus TaxID=7906 RepID=A0A444UE75_ACIRT|nr:hypothetical protein EOD39_5412 [Acipenser ruthenus]
MVKEDIPSLKYSIFFDIMIYQGVENVEKLSVMGNATYRSHTVCEEMQEDIAEVITEKINEKLVMTGAKNGMATKMKQDYPYLENAHCIAHRLALVTSQAANNVTYMQKFQEIITSLYYYVKHSTVHVAKLQEMQKVLDAPLLKIKEILQYIGLR